VSRALSCTIVGVRKLIEEFLGQLEFGVRASSQTVRCYRTDLLEFAQFLRTRLYSGHVPAPEAVDHLAIRAYLSFLHARGVSRSTVARKLASLRS